MSAEWMPLLFLLAIISGACALVVLADYFGADVPPRGLFGSGDSDYMAPWTQAQRKPGDLDV